MEPWIAVLLLTIPLVVLAAFDIDLARQFLEAAKKEPPIPFLWLVTGIVRGVALAAFIFAVLGIQSVVALLLDVRILPPPLPTFVLYAALVGISIPMFVARRAIRRLRAETP